MEKCRLFGERVSTKEILLVGVVTLISLRIKPAPPISRTAIKFLFLSASSYVTESDSHKKKSVIIGLQLYGDEINAHLWVHASPVVRCFCASGVLRVEIFFLTKFRTYGGNFMRIQIASPPRLIMGTPFLPGNPFSLGVWLISLKPWIFWIFL